MKRKEIEDSPSQSKECIFDAFVDFSACLHELDTKFFCEFAALLFSNCTLIGPVAFVPDEYLVDTLRSMLFNVLMPVTDIFENAFVVSE